MVRPTMPSCLRAESGSALLWVYDHFRIVRFGCGREGALIRVRFAAGIASLAAASVNGASAGLTRAELLSFGAGAIARESYEPRFGRASMSNPGDFAADLSVVMLVLGEHAAAVVNMQLSAPLAVSAARAKQKQRRES